jgi:hypothetical protein
VVVSAAAASTRTNRTDSVRCQHFGT